MCTIMRTQMTVAILLVLVVIGTFTVEAFWAASTRISKTNTQSSPRRLANMVDADHNKGTPILSEKLVFAEDDNPFLQLKRQAAFDRFQIIVESLAGFDDDNQLSLIWHSDREVNHAGVVPVNSLLFHQANNMDAKNLMMPVVVVIPSTHKVDIRKLEAHLEEDNHDERVPNSRVKCSLVPADQVEEVCGFPPLSVPPVGHVPHTLRIMVDETLYQQGAILLGGGGHPKIGCLSSAETLLKIEGTELVDLTKDAALLDTNSDATIISKQQQQQQQQAKYVTPLTKPYFQLAPPSLEEAQHVVTHPDEPNPLKPQPITLVGRINGLRRMARRLAFVDIAPVGFVGTATKMDSFELPWRSALDGHDMSVQLIAGKTFCQHRGDQDGAEALKRLKMGQLIFVEGKTNVGNRESLRHWCDKRSFDIVIFDYRILEEAPPREHRPPAHAPINSRTQSAKQKQLQSAMSPSPIKSSSNPLNCLKLSDVFVDDVTIKMVDSKEDIADFQKDLETLSSGVNGDKTPLLAGMDCEWKPNFLLASPEEPQPVLLLQISLQKLNTIYLWDLRALLRPCQEPSEITNEVEGITSEALSKLFGTSQFLKVGFQLMHDLKNLASSYPHIPAFGTFTAVTEVSTIAKQAMQIEKIENSKQLTSSLSRLTKHVLAKPMKKDQQISDWFCRPLSSAQQEYAALDAAVTPVLLEKSLELVGAKWVAEMQLGRKEEDTVFAESVVSIRFLLVKDVNPGIVRNLKAKKIDSNHWLVTQSWVTGREVPSPPSVSKNREGLCIV